MVDPDARCAIAVTDVVIASVAPGMTVPFVTVPLNNTVTDLVPPACAPQFTEAETITNPLNCVVQTVAFVLGVKLQFVLVVAVSEYKLADTPVVKACCVV